LIRCAPLFQLTTRPSGSSMTMAQSVTLSTISRKLSSVQRSCSSTCLRAVLSVPIRRYPMILLSSLRRAVTETTAGKRLPSLRM
jgi:hypothetical protein